MVADRAGEEAAMVPGGSLQTGYCLLGVGEASCHGDRPRYAARARGTCPVFCCRCEAVAEGEAWLSPTSWF